jgi:dUTP pyrophosphatase
MKTFLRIHNQGTQPLPQYQTAGAAGMDVHSNEPTFTLRPMERRLVSTGLSMQVEPGYEVQVRPRSGLALKKGVTVLNTPGTIDSDYRGEVKVILINLSQEPQTIVEGERIAQLVVAQVERVQVEPVAGLSDTARGSGGFGSTGTK